MRSVTDTAKVCIDCERELPLSEFRRNRCRSDGTQSLEHWCATCKRLKHGAFKQGSPLKMLRGQNVMGAFRKWKVGL